MCRWDLLSRVPSAHIAILHAFNAIARLDIMAHFAGGAVVGGCGAGEAGRRTRRADIRAHRGYLQVSEDLTLHAQKSCTGSSSHPVLTCSRLSYDLLLSHPLSKEELTHYVVYLMGSSMV